MQGPPDGYARRIHHTERVEYSYDPETQQATARLVESSDPVIIARDHTVPADHEREVGTFDVTPQGRNIQATQREDAELTVPPGVLARLKAQAAKSGGAATRTETVQYEHDIDTGETDQRIAGPSRRERLGAAAGALAGGARTAAAGISGRAQAYVQATSARAQESFPQTTAAVRERLTPTPRESKPSESLDARIARFLRESQKAQPKAQGGNKRRGSSVKNKDLKQPRYQQPTIVVIRESGTPGRGGRRYGGL